MIRAGTGEAEAALADFDRALALDPANTDALREKARACQKLGRTADAEGLYKRAVELQPAYWGNDSYLGAFYFGLGRYAEAEAAFRKVVEIAPDNVRGHSNLGASLYGQGRIEEAAAEFARAAALRPDATALANVGTVSFYLGRHDEAVKSFEEAVKRNERDTRLWKNLGDALYWTPGRRDEARPALERVVALASDELRVSPDDAGLLIRKADAHAMLNEPVPARALAKRALALAGGEADVMAVAAALYERLGDRQQALAWLGKASRAGYPRWEIERDPALETLRADPRYASVLASAPESAARGDGQGGNAR